MSFLEQIQQDQMFATGLEILKEIESHGFQAFFAGGCCRDLLLGVPCKDVDITTSAPIEVIDEMFHCHDIGKSKSFGLVVVNRNNFQFEVARFRQDTSYSDGRHPDEVNFVDSPEEDVLRRDLTINALLIDSEGKLHDHVNGFNDLQNKIIRAVGDAQQRFEEDGLRILRVVRFCTRFNFTLCEKTREAIQNNLHMLDKVSPERIKDELWKMASQKGDCFANSLELMRELGILDKILPEFTALFGHTHEFEHHPEGDAGEHSIAAIRQNTIPDSIVNIAIAFHDLGKSQTHEIINGRNAFHRHEFASGKIIDQIARRLKFSNEEREAIKFAAVNHMKLHKILEMRPCKTIELMKSPHFKLLVQVSFCDDSCRLHVFNQERWNQVIDRITEIESSLGEQIKKTKVVDGNRVMQLTGLKSGKELGNLIKKTSEWIFDTGTTDQEKIDQKVMEFFTSGV